MIKCRELGRGGVICGFRFPANPLRRVNGKVWHVRHIGCSYKSRSAVVLFWIAPLHWRRMGGTFSHFSEPPHCSGDASWKMATSRCLLRGGVDPCFYLEVKDGGIPPEVTDSSVRPLRGSSLAASGYSSDGRPSGAGRKCATLTDLLIYYGGVSPNT